MDRRIGQLLLIGVVAATVCLVLGLTAWMVGVEATGATLMNIGVVMLMATPVLRVILAVVEFTRARDRAFASIACAVLAILIASVLYALRS